MKKRLWKPPQPSDPAAAVDIPELKEKEKKKKGTPFWMGAGQSTEAVYGSLESLPGVEASQAAASAAVRAAASTVEAAGEAAGVAGGVVSEEAGGFLAQIARSVASYWPASLAGKIAAAGMLLVAAGALAGGAALFAKAAATGVPMAGLGGIVSSLHYRKPQSKSLLYAAAAARNMPSAVPAAQGGGIGKAADAVAAGGFTGQVAPGAPVGQKGNVHGPPALGGAPWSGQNSFDGSAGSGALAGASPYKYLGKNGKLSGAFQKSVDGKGVGGALKVAANTGSPFARLGRFGAGSSQSLGLLRSMMTYDPGMTKASNPTEVRAQLSSEQFDHSNLIGASAPSAPSIGNGTPNLLTTPNPSSTGGAGPGNNSCAQDGLVWNGSGCVNPNTNPGGGDYAEQQASNLTNSLLPIAATLMIVAAVCFWASKVPWLAWLYWVAVACSVLAALAGLAVFLQGIGLVDTNGQKASGKMTAIAGAMTIAGALMALNGDMLVGNGLVDMIIGAVAGWAGKQASAFNPPPPSPSSGGSSGGSSSSSGSSSS
ncbi:MAG: hypothetical protein KGL04_03110, partial [Elusimicrobia bacterium]|nr:hypothetical protein [Elusimicrobiota bacterium]